LDVQLLEAGRDGGQLRLEVFGVGWLLWLPCEIVHEGVTHDGY